MTMYGKLLFSPAPWPEGKQDLGIKMFSPLLHFIAWDLNLC